MGVVIFAMFWCSASSLPHHMLQPPSTTFAIPLLQMPCTDLCYAFSQTSCQGESRLTRQKYSWSQAMVVDYNQKVRLAM